MEHQDTPKAIVNDEYLGDGVYASFDGYHITLDLRGQDRTTRIALEGPVLDALFAYRKRCDGAMTKARADRKKS